MLHVEQCTLRSRIEITGAAVPGAGAGDAACFVWEGVAGMGFAGNVMTRDGTGTGIP